VGGDVLDDFLTRAVADGDAWLGLRADGRTATTTMASGHGTDPAAMVDGLDGTAWSSAAPPQPDDSFGVDLGTARPVSAVRIAMGDGSGSDDFLHDAVLEVAGDDGAGWRRIGEYHDRPVITAALPEGTRAREVRLRATGAQEGALTVREFAVTVSGQREPTATGGAHAAAAVDGDLATAAGSGPLTVHFAGARPLDTVTVAADPQARTAGNGAVPGADAPDGPVSVEVHVAGGSWRRIGDLDAGAARQGGGSGWTELSAGGVLADAVRLGDGAGVREVVPWFAEAPRVTLDRPEVDAEEGGSRAEVTATVSSGLPRNTTVGVRPGVSSGAPGTATPGAEAIRVTVAHPLLPLPRGASAQPRLEVAVARGTAPGTYTVPVRFTVGGRTVERRITVRVHPRTGGPDLVRGSAASSSGNETPDFPASAVADGDPSTRWSSPAKDDAWVQVELASPAKVGMVTLQWQDAYAARYAILTSADGVTWHTAATVADGSGGRETVWLDDPQLTRYVRVQGIRRATRYGYSLFTVAAYAVTR
jgi:hyaluronoglucosaminidase